MDPVSEWGAAMLQKLDFSKLLGFETVSDELTKGLDFQEDTLGDKLGAKVGQPETMTPAGIDFQSDTMGARLGAKVGDPEASG